MCYVQPCYTLASRCDKPYFTRQHRAVHHAEHDCRLSLASRPSRSWMRDVGTLVMILPQDAFKPACVSFVPAATP
eukprot:scaffold21063_cov34-Tisochrysis_lutea.AAC.1